MARTFYTPDDYNKDDVLKISPLLWLIFAFLCRHALTLVLGAFSIFMGSRRGVDTSGLHALFSEPVFVLASLPAIVLLAVNFLRRAKAGALLRYLWLHGRWLLSVSAICDIALLVWQVSVAAMSLSELWIACAFVDIYIVVYLYLSTRARDTFNEFPVATPDKH